MAARDLDAGRARSSGPSWRLDLAGVGTFMRLPRSSCWSSGRWSYFAFVARLPDRDWRRQVERLIRRRRRRRRHIERHRSWRNPSKISASSISCRRVNLAGLLLLVARVGLVWCKQGNWLLATANCGSRPAAAAVKRADRADFGSAGPFLSLFSSSFSTHYDKQNVVKCAAS